MKHVRFPEAISDRAITCELTRNEPRVADCTINILAFRKSPGGRGGRLALPGEIGGMQVAVSVRNAVKRYGTTTALHGVSLDIADNSFFTLLGPSGCGKTTLLRMIAGFEEATEGEILLFGQNIAALEPNLRPVNTVFQNYALFPAYVGARQRGLRPEDEGRRSGRARRARAGQMLELVHLSELCRPHARRSCRAASSSASPWPARWRRSPRCCCWTSRSLHWTSSSAGDAGGTEAAAGGNRHHLHLRDA